MNVITLNGIAKTFTDGAPTTALAGVSLSINKGEFVAIMGSSGSGKSTLMNIIGLLDVPSDGTYVLDGEPVHAFSDKQLATIRGRKIGFIFQSFNLLGRLSAQDNVALPMVYTKTKLAVRQTRAAELLKQVGLEDRAKFRPNQLSGGQMQRVAIARALANNPTILLADEPTGNLDSKTGQKIMELLVQLNKSGNTVIIVTHDIAIARQAGRIITLKDGLVIKDAKR